MQYKMKTLLITSLLWALACAAPLQNDTLRLNGQNGWYVPQADGTFIWMDRTDETDPDMRLLLEPKRSSLVVEFHLYTLENPTEPQLIEATVESIMQSNFNAKNPTRFITHGWLSNANETIVTEVRDAWLSRGAYNIIGVDWSSKSMSYNYIKAASYVSNVGSRLAEFIDFLHKNFQMPFDTLTLIGHSLGAHASGFAGKRAKRGRIGALIGLDTAMPLFTYDSTTSRLARSDADYVESIHTCGGMLGFLEPIGQSAFYPNGGKSQPGCGLDLTGICAHGRAYLYYAEAVRKDSFPAIRCSSYEDAVQKSCGGTYSSVRMGGEKNHLWVEGEYYVPVNKKEPYGKGA